MKRTHRSRSFAVRSSDPFQNLSQDQLAHIGACAMLYNDLEDQIDDIIQVGLRLPFKPQEVLSRINGTDGKVAILKECAAHLGCDKTQMAAIGETLGDEGFSRLKTWRDAVVHARMHDIATSIAHTHAKRGEVSDVLLSLSALKGLYSRLDHMRVELTHLSDYLTRAEWLKRDPAYASGQHKERLEEENRASWSRFLEYQSRRRSLPPMPEFPPDTLDAGSLQRLRDQLEG